MRYPKLNLLKTTILAMSAVACAGGERGADPATELRSASLPLKVGSGIKSIVPLMTKGPSESSDDHLAPAFTQCTQNDLSELSCTIPITSGGGPVLHGDSNGVIQIYFIWFGYSGTPGPQADLNAFVTNANNSNFFGSLSTYTDSTGAAATKFALGGSGPPTGTGCPASPLNEDDVTTIQDVVNCSGFPLNLHSIYFVVTAPGATNGGEFCNDFCGWHSAYYNYIGFIGDANQADCNCSWWFQTPHGSADDAMISVVAHEIGEAVSDPQPTSGWSAGSGSCENGDLCAWTTCSTSSKNGNTYNLTLGSGTSNEYMVQALWANSGAGFCSMCGNCGENQNCVLGSCVCSQAPNCTGKVCGDDGCGGSCGTCTGENSCQSGQCVGAVTISPTTANAQTGTTIQFTAQNGTPPYVFTLSTNKSNGVLNSCGAACVNYTAGAAGNVSDQITVTDSASSTAVATIQVVPTLAIVPASGAADVNTPLTFTATGGKSPYTWSIVTPGSSGPDIAPSSGNYIAGTSPGTDVIGVQDSLGFTTTATVAVNAAVGVSPGSAVIAESGTVNLQTTNGTPPFEWLIQTEGSLGTLTFSTGSATTYNAGTSPTTDTVTVSDASGNFASMTVTVVGPVSLSPPTSIVLPSTGTVQFQATGGKQPYTFKITTNQTTGTVGIQSGAYTAGVVPGTDTITVTDNIGQTATATVTNIDNMTLTPAMRTVETGKTIVFKTTGGSPPLTWVVMPNNSNAQLSATTGTAVTYTAGTNSEADDVVQVTDSIGVTRTATITVTDHLAISATAKTMAETSTVTLNAVRGTKPFKWTLTPGATLSTLSVSGGEFTKLKSGAHPGTAKVTVTDATGTTAKVDIVVVGPVKATPSSLAIAVGGSKQFKATGGLEPYTWTVVTAGSGGTITTTGLYTTGGNVGTDVVEATDSLGQTVEVTITVLGAAAGVP